MSDEFLRLAVDFLYEQEAKALAEENEESQAMVSASLDAVVPPDFSTEEQAQ
jgi:hypothetical protein